MLDPSNNDLKNLSAEDLIYELLYWHHESSLYLNRDDSIVWSREKELAAEARYYDVKDEIIARCEKGENKNAEN